MATVAISCLLSLSVSVQAKIKPKSSPARAELNSIRGIITPAAEAVLSSEIQGRIQYLPLRDGQRFKKNQVLVSFECSKLEANLASAKAEHEANVKTLKNGQQLSTLHAIGGLEIEISLAEVKKSQAAVDIAQTDVNNCVIRAPFSGRVVKTLVNQYESVNPYDQLLSILDDSRYEIELILPSTALQWVGKDKPFDFTVDETGKTHKATVAILGASIDPVSQTFRITGHFLETPQDILSGMSGSAHFPDQPIPTTESNTQAKAQTKTLSQTKAHNAKKNVSGPADLSLKPTRKRR